MRLIIVLIAGGAAVATLDQAFSPLFSPFLVKPLVKLLVNLIDVLVMFSLYIARHRDSVFPFS